MFSMIMDKISRGSRDQRAGSIVVWALGWTEVSCREAELGADGLPITLVAIAPTKERGVCWVDMADGFVEDTRRGVSSSLLAIAMLFCLFELAGRITVVVAVRHLDIPCWGKQ